MTTPTQRSLAMLRSLGLTAQVVERWNPYARIRQDLYGFGDILAFSPQHGIVIVQTTAGSCVAARKQKIEENEHAIPWLSAGGRIEVHGWAKRGGRGKRKTWTCRRLVAILGPQGETFGSGIVGWIEDANGEEAGP